MSAPLRPTSRRALALLFLAVAAAFTALGSLRVHRQHQVVKLGYELNEASAELRQKHEENRRLRLELSVLTAPDRIERLAEGMGLGPPAPNQIRSARLDGARPAREGEDGERAPARESQR